MIEKAKDLDDLRQVLVPEFLRLMKSELDELEFEQKDRERLARKVIAEAESKASNSTREAITVAFHHQVESEKATFRRLEKALRDGDARAALEQRFLDLAREEMGALRMTEDERRDLAGKVVKMVFRQAQITHLSLEEAFNRQAQVERDALQKIAAEAEEIVKREKPQGPDEPRSQETRGDEDRDALVRHIMDGHLEMALLQTFIERMRKPFERYQVGAAYDALLAKSHTDPEAIEQWVKAEDPRLTIAQRFVRLVRSKADSDELEAIRGAFDRQMAIEETASHFVRDVANAGRESPELGEVREDLRREFLEVVGPELERFDKSVEEQQRLTERVLEAAEKRVVQDPSLPLRVAFCLQLAAEEAAIDELKREHGVDQPEPTPAPSRAASLTEKEKLQVRLQAADLLVQASKLGKSGDLDGATRLVNQARQTSESVDDGSGVARAWLELARIEGKRDRLPSARLQYDRALDAYRGLGHAQNTALVEKELGDLLAAHELPRAAQDCWERALALYTQCGRENSPEALDVRRCLGQISDR
jgi:tetratricopeptide (TPR) repeat protein